MNIAIAAVKIITPSKVSVLWNEKGKVICRARIRANPALAHPKICINYVHKNAPYKRGAFEPSTIFYGRTYSNAAINRQEYTSKMLHRTLNKRINR
jgi:hypothetical protein